MKQVHHKKVTNRGRHGQLGCSSSDTSSGKRATRGENTKAAVRLSRHLAHKNQMQMRPGGEHVRRFFVTGARTRGCNAEKVVAERRVRGHIKMGYQRRVVSAAKGE